jgi:hypothetical protein
LRNTHIVCQHIRQFVLVVEQAPFLGVKDIRVQVYIRGSSFHKNSLGNLPHQGSSQTQFANSLRVDYWELLL